MTRAPMRDGHLGEQQAHATCAGMHERRVSGLEREGGVGEVMRSHTLEHGSGGLLGRERLPEP